MATFLQQLINGISQGSAYALIALGYTMVYGVLRLINFAHSDVYMFGAFMGYYLANNPLDQVHVRRIADRSGRGDVDRHGPFCGSRNSDRAIRLPARTQRDAIHARLLAGILGAAAGQLIVQDSCGMSRWAPLSELRSGSLAKWPGCVRCKQDSRLALLIIAIGVSLFLENGGQLAFGADPKFFPEIIPYDAVEYRRIEGRQPEADCSRCCPSS